MNVPVVSQRQALTIQTERVKVPQNQLQSHDFVLHVMTDEAVRLARQAQIVEVARVLHHERVVSPAGQGSSVRERANRFGKARSAKHMTSVEGPRASRGERQKESLVSDVEQDACVSTDQSLGAVSLTDPVLSQENEEEVSR